MPQIGVESELKISLTLAGVLDSEGRVGSCPAAGQSVERMGQVQSQTVSLFEDTGNLSQEEKKRLLEETKPLIVDLAKIAYYKFLSSNGTGTHDPNYFKQRGIYPVESDRHYQRNAITHLGVGFTRALEFDLNRRNGNKLPPVEY